jgi:plasmid rolling circle replication initiator protein Rep
MKVINKVAYFITNETTNNEIAIAIDSLNKAEEIKEFLYNTSPEHSYRIEQREIEIKEIEKGDKIHHVKYDGTVDTSRTDEVISISKNLWGDIIYKTKEINGNRRGEVCPKYVVLAQ